MNFEDTLKLGPLNLPVRYLVFIASFAVGYIAMSFALRRRNDLRRAGANRYLNALALFVVIWKLEPMVAALVTGIARGHIDFQTVVLQAFVPGGDLAAAIGAAVAAVYLVASILRADGRPQSHAAATVVAVVPAILFYFAALIVLHPHPAGIAAQGSASAGAATLTTGTAVGDRAPLFDATGLDGGTYRLANARGKVIVLNFWATWCPPCRAELPDLVRFASTHSSSRVAVWAVNMTNSEPSAGAVRSFSRVHRIDFPVLLDPRGSLAHTYGVTAVPTTYVISPDGVILAKQIGAMSPSWLRSQTSAYR